MSLDGHDRILQQYWRDDMGYPAIKLTSIGGFACALTAGEALYEGEVVSISTGGGSNVLKVPANGDMPMGVVYQDAASGASVWVVVTGVAYVKPLTSVTATPGWIIYVSGTAGLVDQSSSLPAVATHNREVGHYLEAGSSAGAIAKAIIHWN